MAETQLDEQAIFETARQIESPAARLRYLEQACGPDAELRHRVAALLEAYEQNDSFLESPPSGLRVDPSALHDSPTIDRPIAERPGAVIGPYKLLQQIGEGGFGVVFLAEQERPVRRRVALKIIKPGMDTREVIARFDAERQALAMMEHPNIAKVFQAGATENGRPYFVMELVPGVPITDYCNQCNLPTRERLELFVTVCDAVQHAHQKGIIHRDIKPSNVLVAHYDDRPVPKIIDFGVAKAIEQRLTEKTVFTEFGQVLGTPVYMSPEQAELSPLGADTRSDIYSLGVLLYELLTGTTPFDKDRLHAAPYDELRRIIREEEPPRPSARISTLAADLATTVAEHRRTDSRRLRQTVHGELDWIVMKALEKDRARRYETAAALGADIEHYLNDEPVDACPPSSVYMIGKFTRRNKTWLSTAAAVLLTALVGLGASAILIARERDAAEESARREAIAAQEADRQRQRAEANLRQSRAAVDRLFTRAAVELANVPHMTEVRRALLEDAAEFYEGFLQQKGDDLIIREEMGHAYQRLGFAYEHLGRYDDAVTATQKAARVHEELAAADPATPDHRFRLSSALNGLAVRLRRSGRTEEAVATMRRALTVAERLASEYPTVAGYRRWAARVPVDVANQLGGVPGAEQERVDLCRLSLTRWQQFRNDFPALEIRPWDEGHSHHWLASNLMKIGEYEEAEEHLRRSQQIRRQLLEEAPDDAGRRSRLAHVETYLAQAQSYRGATVEAEQHVRSAVQLLRPLVDDFPGVAEYRVGLKLAHEVLAQVLIAQQRSEEAEEVYLRNTSLFVDAPTAYGIGSYDAAWDYYKLGLLQHELDKSQSAADSFRQAFARFEQVLSEADAESSWHGRAKGALRWTLVACPMSQFHDAKRSIAYSNESLQQAPESADYWNSLGIGHYRAGDFEGAIEALTRSIALGGDDDASNYYFLAMAHWRRGDQGEAHQWYQRGVAKEREAAKGFDLNLANFRDEAEKLLGLDEKSVDDQPANNKEAESASDAPNQMSPESDTQTDTEN